MPQFGRYKTLSNIIVYLFDSAENAESNVGFGGSGFFIQVPSIRWPSKFWHSYIVTNWHVAVSDGFSVPRLNRNDDSTDSFRADPSDWIYVPNGPDVAILPMHDTSRSLYSSQALRADDLMTREEMSAADITAGEDIFMLGRFIDYTGHTTNVPAMRFGHISMIDAKIKDGRGNVRPQFIIDCHSRSGFSGSPVFVYRVPGANLGPGNILRVDAPYLRLLGIHWGQFPEKWELKKSQTPIAAEVSLDASDRYVEGLSGMTCVAPAWEILEVLNCSEAQEKRDKAEKILKVYYGPPEKRTS